MVSYIFIALLVVTAAGYMLGFVRARSFATQTAGVQQHSLAGYHGAYVAAWTGIPALLLVLLGYRTQWGDPLEFARVTATAKTLR